MTEEEFRSQVMTVLLDMKGDIGKLLNVSHTPSDCELRGKVDSLLLSRAFSKGFYAAIALGCSIAGGGVVAAANYLLGR